MTNKDNELAKNRPTKRQICIQAIVAADKPEATQEDKDALYKAMRDHPKTMGIFSDLAHMAACKLAGAFGHSYSTDALWMLKHRTIRRELGYEQSSPVERLLIEQVALCYLRMYHAEGVYTHVLQNRPTPEEVGYWDKRLSAVQRRYLRAVETLTRVRRLLGLPPVQVNIALAGGQQVVANAPAVNIP